MLKQKLYLECFGLQSCSQAAPAQRMLIPKSWNTREKLPERAAEQQGMAGEDEDGLVSALGFPGTLWLGLSSAALWTQNTCRGWWGFITGTSWEKQNLLLWFSNCHLMIPPRELVRHHKTEQFALEMGDEM